MDLEEVIIWIRNNYRKTKSDGSQVFLSATRLLEECRARFPAFPITHVMDFRHFLKSISFKWANLHSSHYFKISHRQDVIQHRSRYAPLMARLISSGRHAIVFADGSFFYENEHSDMAWVDLCDIESDLVPAGTGKGRRINNWEFLTKHGVLRHPDGRSAGTLFPPGKTLDSEDIYACIERGVPAILAYARQLNAIPVLVIDGAKINTAKESNWLNPTEMNLSDGGANRGPMAMIGTRGLRSVLTALGRWPPSGPLRLEDARRLLFGWDAVRAQRTRIEDLCARNGIVAFYNSKAHPVFNAIEKLWRFMTKRLENLYALSVIQPHYESLLEEMMSPNEENMKRIRKWVNLAQKYLLYSGRGGTEILKEASLRAFDLSRLPSLPKVAIPHDAPSLLTLAHELNWLVIRGKAGPTDAAPWSAPVPDFMD